MEPHSKIPLEAQFIAELVGRDFSKCDRTSLERYAKRAFKLYLKEREHSRLLYQRASYWFGMTLCWMAITLLMVTYKLFEVFK